MCGLLGPEILACMDFRESTRIFDPGNSCVGINIRIQTLDSPLTPNQAAPGFWFGLSYRVDLVPWGSKSLNVGNIYKL